MCMAYVHIILYYVMLYYFILDLGGYIAGIIPIALGHRLTHRPKTCQSVLLHEMAAHYFIWVEPGQLNIDPRCHV